MEQPSQHVSPQDSLLLSLYEVATGVMGPLAQLTLRRRLRQGKEDPERLAERMGRTQIARPTGPLVWVHGASVGESLSVLPLIEELNRLHPDWHFLVTTGTITSARLMAARLPEVATHQFIPLDHPAYVRRFLDHWQPDACIFVESELWPNLIRQTAARAIPMALVNGRLSPKSFENWRKRKKAGKALLSAFTVILAQDGPNGARLTELSGKKVPMVGSLKMAAPALPGDAAEADRLSQSFGNRPVWLAASTHQGEEESIIATHIALKNKLPDLLTVMVPRHPERGNSVAAMLEESRLSYARRSHEDTLQADHQIYLADTLGELGIFYRVCEITFLGGSLVPIGGHNPLEPARLSSAILFGPHVFNFEDTYSGMRKYGGAAMVRNERDLSASLSRLLSDQMTRVTMARKAHDWASESAETVLANILEEIAPILPDGARQTPNR